MDKDNRLTTDDSLWPILIHETIGVPSEADVVRMMAKSDECLHRGETYIVLFDNSRAGKTPKYLRSAGVRWYRNNKKELHQHCLGHALVVSSPTLRFLSSTFMLLTTNVLKQEVFATFDEAMDWCEKQLSDAGIPYPSTRLRRAQRTG